MCCAKTSIAFFSKSSLFQEISVQNFLKATKNFFGLIHMINMPSCESICCVVFPVKLPEHKLFSPASKGKKLLKQMIQKK